MKAPSTLLFSFGLLLTACDQTPPPPPPPTPAPIPAATPATKGGYPTPSRAGNANSWMFDKDRPNNPLGQPTPDHRTGGHR